MPSGWIWTTIGQICEKPAIVDPKSNPTKTFRYVDISSISNETFTIVNPKTLVGAEAPSRARKSIKGGDILVSTVRTYLRNIAIVPPELDGEICSTGLCVLRTIERIVEPRLVFRYVISNDFVNRLTREQRGISYPAVTDRYVYSQQFPLPPLAEQKKISARIEESFSRITLARDSLQKVLPMVQKFRLSVLAKAFRGEFTKRSSVVESGEELFHKISLERRKTYDSQHHDYKQPERADPSELPEIPKTWTWVRLEEICSQITDGTHITPKYTEKGIRFLSVKNVREGVILDDDVKYISEEQYRELIKHCKPEKGDILYTKVGSIGKAAVVSVNYGFSIFVSLALLKPLRSVVLSKFLEYLLNSPLVLAQALARKKGIGVPDLHLIEIRDFKLCIPPLDEQGQIVEVIDRLYARSKAAEKSIRRGLDSCAVLEQSILSKAFRGKLVPQDPNDEPAFVLLEGIKAPHGETSRKGKLQTLLEIGTPAKITPKA